MPNSTVHVSWDGSGDEPLREARGRAGVAMDVSSFSFSIVGSNGIGLAQAETGVQSNSDYAIPLICRKLPVSRHPIGHNGQRSLEPCCGAVVTGVEQRGCRILARETSNNTPL